VTDDEWDKQRSRAVMAAFQTGRPVFADTDGEVRYVDGDREKLPEDVGVPKAPVSRAAVELRRASRASLWAARTSIIAAIGNAIVGYWRPWEFAVAGVCVISTVLWMRVHRGQRSLLGARS
jgi:hypothetical protein